ncbi:hypothetical protein [Neomegalonema sp.]|uniref:hypothetical protein n=1 Tax=Neomegalonema sp. TaxID=2039713 RepID=UPI002637EDC3|nr:hypothetical protein [Neomegalonema sp.]MDD2867904.1 hypothetical protein [Neomegalonema sp.]
MIAQVLLAGGTLGLLVVFSFRCARFGSGTRRRLFWLAFCLVLALGLAQSDAALVLALLPGPFAFLIGRIDARGWLSRAGRLLLCGLVGGAGSALLISASPRFGLSEALFAGCLGAGTVWFVAWLVKTRVGPGYI